MPRRWETSRARRRAALYEAFAASGKRLELLDLLAQGELTVEALSKTAGLNVTTTSAHLQTLKQAGLVAARRDGPRMYYRLAGDDVAQLLALLCKVAEAHQPAVLYARAAYLGTQESAEISREELVRLVDSGEPVVLDVRPRDEYLAGHIPGAICIPVNELTQRITELPTGAQIVVYCRGEYCAMAYDAVQMLTDRERRAIRLSDGMLEWRLDELPVDAGTPQ